MPLVAVGLLLAGLLALAGGWALWSATRAAAVWPEDQEPLTMREPALPLDPEAPARFAEMVELIPSTLDNAELGDALEAEGLPQDEVLLPDELQPAIVAMDALVESSGLRLEPWSIDQGPPPMLELLALSRARLLRAWRYADAGRSDEAMAEMLRTARLGLMLEHSDCSLLSTMVGLAIGDEALDEILELAAWEQPPSPQLLAAATREIEAAAALPSGFEGAVLGECQGAEDLYDRMRWWSREQLMATTEPSLTSLPERPPEPGGRECCFPVYDADRTIQMVRERCRAVAAAARAPQPERSIPSFETLAGKGPLQVGAWLDNSVGRVLLDISTPSYGAFLERGDALATRRAVAVAWLGVVRWQRGHPGRPGPAALQGLVPEILSELPVDPYDGEPVVLDAEQGVVHAARASELDEDLRRPLLDRRGR